MENLTDEMLQTMAFEVAKIAVQTKAQITMKNIGETLDASNLAIMMKSEYDKALYTLSNLKRQQNNNDNAIKRTLK